MLILASRSPRRAELLTQVGIAFSVRPADVDETARPGEPAADYVRRMARAKAAAVQRQHPGPPVLGADTAVVLDDLILGKPRDRDDAIGMLLALSGRSHRVMSGVAVALDAGSSQFALSTSTVRFRTLDRAEALAYWDTGEPADKAGAYAIQGLGTAFVARIEGSYSGIMGLPLFETLALLRNIGIRSRVDLGTG